MYLPVSIPGISWHYIIITYNKVALYNNLRDENFQVLYTKFICLQKTSYVPDQFILIKANTKPDYLEKYISQILIY